MAKSREEGWLWVCRWYWPESAPLKFVCDGHVFWRE